MYDVLIWSAVFIVSLATLIKASDAFVKAAERIGLHFGVPAFIIGVTIVAIGTSLPELASGLVAVFEGASEIVIGTVVGSNIANILLILGVASFIGKKIKISYHLNHVDMPLLIGATFLFGFMIWDGSLSSVEGIILLIFLGTYLHYVVRGTTHAEETPEKSNAATSTITRPVAIIAISALFIYLGARYAIESVIELSGILNIGAELIAVSAVAIGTSLPELTVSISAARRGNMDLIIGNILGSNIFNTLAITSIPALFGSLVVTADILMLGLPVMLMATLLFFIVTHEQEVTRWEGAMLLLFYMVFIGKLFNIF